MAVTALLLNLASVQMCTVWLQNNWFVWNDCSNAEFSSHLQGEKCFRTAALNDASRLPPMPGAMAFQAGQPPTSPLSFYAVVEKEDLNVFPSV